MTSFPSATTHRNRVNTENSTEIEISNIHPNQSYDVYRRDPSSDPTTIFSETLRSAIKTLVIFLFTLLLIFIIYYLVPKTLKWFTPFGKGGICMGCSNVLNSRPDVFYSKDFRSTCTCDCWDGRSKGPYPRGNFKYIYYQVEPTTLFLVGISVLIVILFYQSMLNLLNLILNRNCNWFIVPVFFCSWYGIYYSYQQTFNYFNEDAFVLSYHQAYFTITECVMTFTTYVLLSSETTRCLLSNGNTVCKSKVFSFLLWFVMATSITHSVQIVLDQGLSKINDSIFLRDLLLFVTDLPYTVMSGYYLGLHQFIKYYLGMGHVENDFLKSTWRNLFLTGMSVLAVVWFLSNVTFGG